MQSVESVSSPPGPGAFRWIVRLAAWVALAIGIGAVVLSVLVLLPAIVVGAGGQRPGVASVYAAWFVSLVTNVASGIIVMLPVMLLVGVCWAFVAHRAPQLEQTLAGVMKGAAALALAITAVAWMIKRGGDGSSSNYFSLALFLACWLGLFIPRWCVAYLHPGKLLFATDNDAVRYHDAPGS